MVNEKPNLISHAHLLRMTMLSQRAVHYAVKAYELRSVETCQLVRDTEHDVRELQSRIGNRGRTLNAAGEGLDAHSLSACCALRMYSALRVICTAATEIGQNTWLILHSGLAAERPSTSLREATKFVDGLVSVYTVAMFNGEKRHAETILDAIEEYKWLGLAFSAAQDEIARQAGAHAKLEMAIVRCLGQIAEQACELADTITLWLDGQDCMEIEDECAA